MSLLCYMCVTSRDIIHCFQTGSTALHHAATYGHDEVACMLLDHKSFVNGRTKVRTGVKSGYKGNKNQNTD